MTPKLPSSFGPRRFWAVLLASLLLVGLLPGAVAAATAPTITSANNATFTVGVASSFTVTTTGVPTPTIVESGSLPGGVTFTDNSDGTGTLAGTPAAASDGGYPITFTAANGTAPDAVQNFTLTVNPSTAPTITSANSTTFTVGVAGTFTVTTTGLPVPTIVRTGAALPTGVTFVNNGNGTGTLAGTPAAATNGSYAITFTASNGTAPDAVQSFTLTVNPGTAPAITSANSTTFTVGVAGTFTVTTTGIPAPTIVRTGAALPSGVTFVNNGNGTGTLSGTPAAATNGSYAITFTASNGNSPSAVQNFTLTVALGTAPTITSAASTTFTVGVAGTFTVTTTGIPAPTIVRTGAALPSGVTFVNNGNGTGTLSGTPAAATNGSYAITFTASNGNSPSAVQNFTLTVNLAGPSVTIDQAVGQADPTATSPINFTVVFSSSVTGFATGDVSFGSSTAGGTKVGTVSGSGTTYNVAVTGMTTAGTVVATISAGVAQDGSSRPNLASTSTDNTVTWAPGSPTVTINQASGQADPTSTSPINFTVVFSATVTGFATGDVTISGTAGGTKTATVTGSGTTYNVAVTGMTTSGTVIATIPAGVATNASTQTNLASTSTDNTVTWNQLTASITLTTSAPIPPGAHNPVILWGQGFTLGVQFAANGAGKSFQLQAQRDGVTWNTIATLTTDASGHASFFYTPVTNLYYRAVFAGTPDLAAANSNQVRTVVRELALLRPTNNGATKTINRNTSITFSTTVRPARPELAPATVSFYFYRLSSGAYRLVTTRNVVIDSAGLARTTFRFTTSGKWYVRSQANPTAYNANSVMTLEKYSVR